jgi:hypothetical protein
MNILCVIYNSIWVVFCYRAVLYFQIVTKGSIALWFVLLLSNLSFNSLKEHTHISDFYQMFKTLKLTRNWLWYMVLEKSQHPWLWLNWCIKEKTYSVILGRNLAVWSEHESSVEGGVALISLTSNFELEWETDWWYEKKMAFWVKDQFPILVPSLNSWVTLLRTVSKLQFPHQKHKRSARLGDNKSF